MCVEMCFFFKGKKGYLNFKYFVQLSAVKKTTNHLIVLPESLCSTSKDFIFLILSIRLEIIYPLKKVDWPLWKTIFFYLLLHHHSYDMVICLSPVGIFIRLICIESGDNRHFNHQLIQMAAHSTWKSILIYFHEKIEHCIAWRERFPFSPPLSRSSFSRTPLPLLHIPFPPARKLNPLFQW